MRNLNFQEINNYGDELFIFIIGICLVVTILSAISIGGDKR